MAYEQHQRVVIDDGTGANPPNAALGSQSNPVSMLDAWLASTTTTWTSATALNTAITATTNGYDTALVTISCGAGITGGQITWEGYDGVNWIPIKAARTDSYLTDSAVTLAANLIKAWQVPVAGFPQFRARLSTAIAGAGNVGVQMGLSSAPDTSIVTVGLDPSQPLPPGTNMLGAVATQASARVAVTPAVTAAAYTSGKVMGGVMTFPNLLAPTTFQGLLESIELKFKASAQTSGFYVAIFSASPTGTFTDNAAPAINAADTASLLGVYHLTGGLSVLGTHTIFNMDGIAKDIVGASSTLYAVVVTDAASAALASTSDMTLALAVLQG